MDRDQFLAELSPIEGFVRGLGQVQRALAHVPVYMIFDDHDVTDDWNLTRGWEESAYDHSFSQRIIGNTLIGYWLFQAWGNDPDRFDEDFLEDARKCFQQSDGAQQDTFIERLLDFEHWHFSLPTSPKLVVLDTRTHRWWSESSMSRPSGLMDWESLSELQQDLLGEPTVVLVSPPPIFGVKLIESGATRSSPGFGQAAAGRRRELDGASRRTGERHPERVPSPQARPQRFTILSGDVHYSFVYDVSLRFRAHSPKIWQITCSGLKNEFPPRLLAWFDRLNQWFYRDWSPLNWFTKRRRMRIRAQQPEGWGHRRLVNCSGVCRVVLDDEGTPLEICLLPSAGGEVRFVSQDEA